MSETLLKVILIVLLSILFPLVGYYLDYRAKKKKYKK
ncbi:MAG: hypothetical protein ACI85I_001087 [Arenicella sp.]|jgi:hypothetical protein